MELTVDQSSVKQPLAEQVEDAVDFRPSWSREGPGLPAALVGAGQQRGRRGGLLLLLLLLLLLRCFGWLSPTGGGALARRFGDHRVPLLATVRRRGVGDGRGRRHAHSIDRGGWGTVSPGT